MNVVAFVGRLVNKPELKKTSGGASVARFRLAVNRTFKNANGEREADFFPVVVWNKQAENAVQYLDKGSQVSISGRLQSSSFDGSDGKRVFLVEVVADSILYLDTRANNNSNDQQGNFQPQGQQGNFQPQGQQGNFQPQGQGNFQPQGQGNFQPQGQENFQPQGQGNFQPQGQGNFQPQGQGNFQPQGQQGNFQPQGQGNFQPQGQQPNPFGQQAVADEDLPF